MQLEVGKIVEGKVSGITKFGAFVDLGEGKTGMVHISEVAAAFVQEIKDYVKKTCNHDITDEELMYLTVHIKRVTTR